MEVEDKAEDINPKNLGLTAHGMQVLHDSLRDLVKITPQSRMFRRSFKDVEALQDFVDRESIVDLDGEPLLQEATALCLHPSYLTLSHISTYLESTCTKQEQNLHWVVDMLKPQDTLCSGSLEEMVSRINSYQKIVVILDPNEYSRALQPVLLVDSIKCRFITLATALKENDSVVDFGFSKYFEDRLVSHLCGSYRSFADMRSLQVQMNLNDEELPEFYSVSGVTARDAQVKIEKALDDCVEKFALKILPDIVQSYADRPLQMAYCYSYSGMWLHNSYRYKSAAQLYKRAIKLLYCLVDEDNQYQLYDTTSFNLGLASWNLSEIDTAIKCFRMCAGIREELRLGSDTIIKCYNYIGDLYKAKGTKAGISHALTYYTKSLEIYQEQDLVHKQSEILEKILSALNSQRLYAKAMEYAQQGLELYQGRGPDFQVKVGTWMFKMGLVYSYMEEHQKAIDTYQATIKELEPHMSDNGVAGIVSDCHYNTGVGYKNLKKIEPAIEAYTKAAEVREQASEKSSIASCHTNIAKCYADTKDYDKAAEFHEKAFNILLHCKGELNDATAEAAFNVGLNYHNGHQYDMAQPWYERCIGMRQKFGTDERLNIALCYYNMALCAEERKDLKLAAEQFLKCATLREDAYTTGTTNVATPYRLSAELWFKIHIFDKCIECYKKHRDITIEVEKETLEKLKKKLENGDLKEEDAQEYHKEIEECNKTIATTQAQFWLYEAQCIVTDKAKREDCFTLAEKAYNYFENARLAEEIPEAADVKACTQALYLMGLLTVESDFDKAMEYLDKSIEVALISYDEDDELVGKSTLAKAEAYYFKGQFEACLKAAQRAYELFSFLYDNRPSSDLTLAARIYGRVLIKKDDAATAVKPLLKCVEYWDILIEDSSKATAGDGDVELQLQRAYFDLSIAYEDAGMFAQALDIYEKAITLNQKRATPSTPALVRCLSNQGCLLLHTEKYQLAEEKFTSALNKVKRGTVDSAVLMSNMLLMKCMMADNDLEQMKSEFDQVKNIFKPALDNNIGIAILLQSLEGLIQSTSNKDGLELCKNAVEMAKENLLPTLDQAEICFRYGIASLLQHDYHRAEVSLTDAISLFNTCFNGQHPRTVKAVKYLRLAKQGVPLGTTPFTDHRSSLV